MPESMTRKEHLQWCKDRANEYARNGDMAGAMASMTSDMSKHPETDNPMGMALMMQLYIAGHLSTPGKMIEFINGFN